MNEKEKAKKGDMRKQTVGRGQSRIHKTPYETTCKTFTFTDAFINIDVDQIKPSINCTYFISAIDV